MQRGGGHRDLPEAREEPLQEAVHAPRHHAEVQVSQGEQQVTGTVLLPMQKCRSVRTQEQEVMGGGGRVADNFNYRTYVIAVLWILDLGLFCPLDPGSGMEKIQIRDPE